MPIQAVILVILFYPSAQELADLFWSAYSSFSFQRLSFADELQIYMISVRIHIPCWLENKKL